MVVEHFELADGATLISWFVKILMDTVLHKEVLEITWQNHYITVHFDWLLAQLALDRAQGFLIKVVQTK